MKPELLLPAGNPEKLRAAILYGADAVYLAGAEFGMRAAADNFTVGEIYEAVRYAHSFGVKAYLTVNTMPRSDEYPKLREYIDNLRGSKIDAVIIADLGVMRLIREMLPDTEIHVSTQASAVSSAVCNAYQKLGANRIVLARELSLGEIKVIRAETSVELETFVHGSMCVSYSGQCLLSEHFTGRDANRGKCTQPCRWEYKIYEIEEQFRPTERLPIMETELGTFVMSSRDLCMIEHMDELIDAGIDSFKIEGRMKSAYYAAVTANCYRMAIDGYIAGKPFDKRLLAELASVSHREYNTGFYFGRPGICGEPGYLREKTYLATAIDGRNFIQRNKLSVGDTVELVSPGEYGRSFIVTALRDMDGNPIASTPHPQMQFAMDVPFNIKQGDIIRGTN
ncbi:MAG: U32 family peptidase [Oscillospiraceae bacterium]|nr:U32 family peptidase [Oscillospiraceae bacterium]